MIGWLLYLRGPGWQPGRHVGASGGERRYAAIANLWASRRTDEESAVFSSVRVAA